MKYLHRCELPSLSVTLLMNTEGKTFQRLCLILFGESILCCFNRSFYDESEVEFVQLLIQVVYLQEFV